MGKGFDTFMKNPFWRKVYENAPNDRVKEYLRLRFDMSVYVKGDEWGNPKYVKDLELITLEVDDVWYLMENAESRTAEKHYRVGIQMMEGVFEEFGLPRKFLARKNEFTELPSAPYAFPGTYFQAAARDPWVFMDVKPEESDSEESKK